MATVRYIVLICVSLALAACQTTSSPTTAVVTVERPPLVLPNVDNIKIQDAEWYVISRDAKPDQEGSSQQAFGKSHSDSLLAVTPRGYENLATNQANLVKIIRQYQAQLQAFKDYYNKPSETKEKDAPDGKSK